MTTATVRDLRTQFPRIKRLLEQDEEVVITDHGQPVARLMPFDQPAPRRARQVDYHARLLRRMPKPISRASRRALDEADRGER
ncbi:MAG: type II toxin-antitoxin system Phd/YefM family antitoxin [Polyangiaceae bacterium]